MALPSLSCSPLLMTEFTAMKVPLKCHPKALLKSCQPRCLNLTIPVLVTRFDVFRLSQYRQQREVLVLQRGSRAARTRQLDLTHISRIQLCIYVLTPTTRKHARFAHLSTTVTRQRLRKSKKNPKQQNPKIQKSKKHARFHRCKKFWIFGFLDFFRFLDF